jgi:uncharacterized protein (TIGR03086 family)
MTGSIRQGGTMTHTDTTTTTAPRPLDAHGLAADDPRLTFARAVALGGAVIDGVRPDQLDGPTPCPAMDVRQLLEHLVMVLQRVACAGRGDELAVWPVAVPGVADDAWAAAWTEAAHEVQRAWPDEVLDRPTTLPWATMPGAEVLRIYTNEVAVHTWDLARATGQRPVWDDAVLTLAFAAIRAQMPAEGRAELNEQIRAMVPDDEPFDPPFQLAVAVDDDAPLVDRLVGWNGRDPRWVPVGS